MDVRGVVHANTLIVSQKNDLTQINKRSSPPSACGRASSKRRGSGMWFVNTRGLINYF
jgi:hypothetical protein